MNSGNVSPWFSLPKSYYIYQTKLFQQIQVGVKKKPCNEWRWEMPKKIECGMRCVTKVGRQDSLPAKYSDVRAQTRFHIVVSICMGLW